MAAFSSKNTGNWDAEGATTWNEANHPIAGDTVTIQNGHTVTLDSATACATLTVDAGGVLTDATNNQGFVASGAVVVNGTFTCGSAFIDLQALTIGDGGLYENSTCQTEINGSLVVGGGASGSYTIGTAGIIALRDLGSTVVINAGATLGSAATDYDINFYASMETSAGTFIAPIAAGNFVIRAGSTWKQPSTFTHSSGEVSIVGSGTATLGSNVAFNDMEVANFATLSTLTFNLTLAGDLDIGGGVSGSVVPTTGTITIGGNLNIGTGALFGANTAYTLDLNGRLLNSTGTLSAPNGSGTFTFSGTTFWTPTTFTHNDGIVTFDRAGETTLSNNGLQFRSITINAGTTLNLNGNNLTAAYRTIISGTLTCGASTVSLGSGVIIMTHVLEIKAGGTFNGGSGTHTIGAIDSDTATSTLTMTSGTCTLNGGDSGFNMTISAASTFAHSNGTIVFAYPRHLFVDTHSLYNLTVNQSGDTHLYEDLTIANDFTIAAGGFDCDEDGGASHNVTVAGDFDLTGVFHGMAGTLDFDGDVTINGAGAFTSTTGILYFGGTTWTNSGGTFTHNSGTVVFDGTSQEIDGSNTFYHFTKGVAVADVLTIDNTSTQTFDKNVTLNGAAGQLLSIVSDSGGSAFGFVMAAGAVKTNLDYLSVQDSDASGSDAAHKPIAPTNSVDVSGNTSWFSSGITGKLNLSYYYY